MAVDSEKRRASQRKYAAKRVVGRTDEERAERAALQRAYAKGAQRARLEARKAERRAALDALKAERPCADCGRVFHPCAMDWDHRDPTTKIAGVADLILCAWSRVLEEVAKCDLVCACCHRVRTFVRKAGA